MLYNIIAGSIVIGAWIFMIIGNTWIKGHLFNNTIGKQNRSGKDDIKTGAGLVYYETVIKKIKDSDKK